MLRDNSILRRTGRKEKASSMIAPACQHNQLKRHGHDRHGNQRFRCILCGKTWIQQQPRPLGELRIDKAKAVLCLRLLMEDNSIRSIERLLHVHRDTILSLLELVGRRAMHYWNVAMRDLPANNVQADETWGFVYAKEKTCVRKGIAPGNGDAYTYLAIERNTKLILAWHLGRREQGDADQFSQRLQVATSGRFQLTTDGFACYPRAVPAAFNGNIDFAQLVKQYASVLGRKAEARYSPSDIIGIKKTAVWGQPNMDLVCTSHVERSNLSIRMGVRRMTRLTNAFSKKWENHEAHLAIWFLYYNFCRVHMTIKTTPAVKAGIADEKWSVERLLDELAIHY
jgi:transposase-like protein/IS1 family transposase